MPETGLQSVIYCYWQLKSDKVLTEPFLYRVVADGCIDIFFELSNPQNNFVMGFCKKFTEFPLANSFHYIGVRFLPTMFPQLFKINASELCNRFEQLSNVVPNASAFITDTFHSELTIKEIKTTFDDYFRTLVANAAFNNDRRLYKALEIIFKESGGVNVEQDLSTGISQRQLRRLFEFYIGDTVKTFSKVVRFQSILRSKPSSQSLRQNKLFFDVGYYDQAHFIKEFKNFYGVTPGKAFNR
ncbi:helix-turn-helix domain-containing protein [Maribellus sp. CM-23]|uniref:AraC family transcriptional regulator n=1 Tax=Maribellus sp. CM-23 TaxID=2781026 RepID=UPI00293E243C|nr:helix-turn-helix domain-containing protein [Maribellus sp. CM-23]